MLITFKTRASTPNITMFGDVALTLLKMMGRRDTVPSAMVPEDIPDALKQLRNGLETIEAELDDVPPDADEDHEKPVSLRSRATPLLELLEASQRENVGVMWEQGGKGI